MALGASWYWVPCAGVLDQCGLSPPGVYTLPLVLQRGLSPPVICTVPLGFEFGNKTSETWGSWAVKPCPCWVLVSNSSPGNLGSWLAKPNSLPAYLEHGCACQWRIVSVWSVTILIWLLLPASRSNQDQPGPPDLDHGTITGYHYLSEEGCRNISWAATTRCTCHVSIMSRTASEYK